MTRHKINSEWCQGLTLTTEATSDPVAATLHFSERTLRSGSGIDSPKFGSRSPKAQDVRKASLGPRAGGQDGELRGYAFRDLERLGVKGADIVILHDGGLVHTSKSFMVLCGTFDISCQVYGNPRQIQGPQPTTGHGYPYPRSDRRSGPQRPPSPSPLLMFLLPPSYWDGPLRA